MTVDVYGTGVPIYLPVYLVILSSLFITLTFVLIVIDNTYDNKSKHRHIFIVVSLL